MRRCERLYVRLNGMIPRRCGGEASGDETEILLDAVLEAGLCGSIQVAGDEMRPALQCGDRIVVTPFLGLPHPGQMVIAHHQGRIVVRRLVDVRLACGRRRYCLEADTPPARRFEVLREDLIGRPSAILRRGVVTPIAEGIARGRRAPRRMRTVRRRDR